MAEYLDSNPEPEPSGVNKFLKGLGESGPPSSRLARRDSLSRRNLTAICFQETR